MDNRSRQGSTAHATLRTYHYPVFPVGISARRMTIPALTGICKGETQKIAVASSRPSRSYSQTHVRCVFLFAMVSRMLQSQRSTNKSR